jgi:hypothetical protein
MAAASWTGWHVGLRMSSLLCHRSCQIVDFTHTWLYVFGVSVLGRMVLRERAKPPTQAVGSEGV